MGFKQETNDPIVGKMRKGTPDDPHKRIMETLQVINGTAQLTEIPTRFDKVIVTGALYPMYEKRDGELSENTYQVDYTQGVVFFHANIEAQYLVFKYVGRGAHFFPANRIYLTYDKDFGNAELKFKDIDRELAMQSSRVDTLIRMNPQPSEVIDTRVDWNGKIFPTSKHRIDSEQKKIEQAYTDLDGKVLPSLKARIDQEQKKIDDATFDKNGKSFYTLKERINSEQEKIEETYTGDDGKKYTSMRNRFERIDDDFISHNERIANNKFRLDNRRINIKDLGATGNIEQDATPFIQQAMDYCYGQGGGEVYCPPGKYKLTDKLVIRDYVTLYTAKGSFFYRYHDHTMLTNGFPNENFYGYEGHSHFSIIGDGVWDCRGTHIAEGSNCFSFGHAKDITIEGSMYILDVKGGHGIELGGIDGCRIRGVNLLGFVDPGDRSFSEAIQIDLFQPAYPALIPNDLPSMREFGHHDNTVCKNIFVDGVRVGKSNTVNTTSYGRGVGGHAIAIGTAFENIKVTNCDFEDTLEQGVRLIGANNATITGNHMRNCGGGVLINPPVVFKLKDTIDLDGKVTNSSQSHNTFVITDNRVYNNDRVTHGIALNGQPGGVLDKATITGNIVKNCLLNGIYVKMGKNVTVTGNVVDSVAQNGISVTSVTNATVTGNTVDKSKAAGIYLGEGIFADGEGGPVNYSTISSNTVLNSGTHNVTVTNSSKGVTISGNTLIDATDNGIFIGDNSQYISLGNNLIMSNNVSKRGLNITDSVKEVQMQPQSYFGTFKTSKEEDYSSSDRKLNTASNELYLMPNDYIALTLKNGATGELNVAKFGNQLQFKGMVNDTSTAKTIATLPAGLRAPVNWYVTVPTTGTTGIAKLRIFPDGNIQVLGFVSNNSEALSGYYMDFNMPIV